MLAMLLRMDAGVLHKSKIAYGKLEIEQAFAQEAFASFVTSNNDIE